MTAAEDNFRDILDFFFKEGLTVAVDSHEISSLIWFPFEAAKIEMPSAVQF